MTYEEIIRNYNIHLDANIGRKQAFTEIFSNNSGKYKSYQRTLMKQITITTS